MKIFNLDDYLADLKYLVNFDNGSYTPSGTAKVADFFSEKFKSAGWYVEEIEVSDKVGPCLKITNCSDDTYDLLLLGHMDTVFPEGTATQRPYKIDESGIVTGVGVSDMKGCILLSYYALLELQAANKLNNTRICFLLNSDEEISSIYSRSLIEEVAKKCKYALVIEAARKNGDMVKLRSGVGHYKLTATGVAAHAGVNPQDGSSALNELAHWIIKLHQLSNYDIGTSVNVGIVHGGSAVNVVTDYATAEVDVRFRTLEEAARIEAAIQALTEQSFTAGGAKVTYEGGINRPVMLPSKETLALCDTISKFGKELNIDFNWVETGGGSDGNFTAALGLPTVDGMGPIGAGGHSTKEWLDTKSVEPRLKLQMKTIDYIVHNLE
ncbi:MAG: Glutamate carboxypeptidase [Firmicutes bacterium]|nr:Glutamate carboxypeptidase [Bacillota bacterium]